MSKQPLNRILLMLITAAAAGSCVGAYAAEHSIRQKGRSFSAAEITIKKGENVTFINDDTVPHNIYSSSPGNEFDVGSQAPGVSIPVTFTTADDVAVRCLIHPRMSMTVRVTD